MEHSEATVSNNTNGVSRETWLRRLFNAFQQRDQYQSNFPPNLDYSRKQLNLDVRCPAHKDNSPSLSLGVDGDTFLLHCHAGCSPDRILAAVRLEASDLFYDRRVYTNYLIRDRANVIQATHQRVVPGKTKSKDFWWYRPDGTPGLNGRPVATLPLYGIQDLKLRPDLFPLGTTVYVAEGENCREYLHKREIPSVATVTGAEGTPRDEVLRDLVGYEVVCVCDADTPGRLHMLRVAAGFERVGIAVQTADPFPDETDGTDVANWEGDRDALLTVLRDAPAIAQAQRVGEDDNISKSTVWDRAVTAAAFVAQKESTVEWIEPRLIARGALTEWYSPRGLGKTQIALKLAIKHARQGCRVLLLDRDNPPGEIQRRLNGWGAADVTNLKILTRNDVPSLTDPVAWRDFPVTAYDWVILDAFDSAAEGVGEQDSAKPSKAIKVLLDIAHREHGPALLTLGNTTKNGAHGRGSGVLEDRADISYEVRDATDLVPSGTKPWWAELPPGDRGDWASRATRRTRREQYRLAFVPSKFRIGVEPEPFAFEINHAVEPWGLREVTEELTGAVEQATADDQARTAAHEQAAIDDVVATMERRASKQETPLTKGQAETVLHTHQIGRDRARELLAREDGKRWRLVKHRTLPGQPVEVLPPLREVT